ncbi:MAG: IS3 family transposase, partial [Kiritimatiellae bacterium]|nr:IS3 family transposase [Kiritimatiellia bacterium]
VKHCTIVNRKKRHTPWFVLHKEQAVEHVKRVFNGSHQCYGAEKIAAVLKKEGRKIGVDCIRRVMQEQKMVSVRGIYRHEYLKELRSRDNLINREFNPAAPNMIWVSDVTEIWHKDKKLYICVVIDLFSRKVVSWRIGQFNNTRLTLGAFLHAFTKRGNPEALTFHTDRGANYTSFCFTRRLHQLQVKRSFSKAHNPYDNSVCEAFFKSIKAEELYRRRYRSMREFRNSVAAYIAEYNAKRSHAANNYLTPDEKENRWSGANTDEAVRSRLENKGINSETEPSAQKSNAKNSEANP